MPVRTAKIWPVDPVQLSAGPDPKAMTWGKQVTRLAAPSQEAVYLL